MKFDTLAQRMIAAGVKNLLFTDTRKDGTLSGPNILGIRMFLHAAKGVPVFVSGGISSVDELIQLREYEALGLAGVVVGKALYDGKFTLQDAMHAAGS